MAFPRSRLTTPGCVEQPKARFGGLVSKPTPTAVDTLRDIMRKNDGSKSVALRLAAASQILDRGLGRAAQSVALDLNLTKKLDELSDDELIALRDRYAALSGAA